VKSSQVKHRSLDRLGCPASGKGKYQQAVFTPLGAPEQASRYNRRVLPVQACVPACVPGFARESVGGVGFEVGL